MEAISSSETLVTTYMNDNFFFFFAPLLKFSVTVITHFQPFCFVKHLWNSEINIQQIIYEINTTFSCKTWKITNGLIGTQTPMTIKKVWGRHSSLLSVCGAAVLLVPREVWLLHICGVIQEHKLYSYPHISTNNVTFC
jgi:hypothetical protein